MTADTKKTISQIFAERTPIDDALREAGRQAVIQHKQAGLPLAVWENGRMVWITPEEAERRIVAAEEAATQVDTAEGKGRDDDGPRTGPRSGDDIQQGDPLHT